MKEYSYNDLGVVLILACIASTYNGTVIIPLLKGQKMLMQKTLLITLGLVAASAAFATQTEAVYQYLPAGVLKQNIEATLSQHQIDASQLDIQIDDKGIVNASGNVESKQEADNITRIIQNSQAVYAVFGKFIYPQP